MKAEAIEALLEARAATAARRKFALDRINEGGRLHLRGSKDDSDPEYLDWKIDQLVEELEDVIEAHLQAERLTRLSRLALEADDVYSYSSPIRKAATRQFQQLSEASAKATQRAEDLAGTNSEKLTELALWVKEQTRLYGDDVAR